MEKIHFIGINGSGIGGTACIAKSRGFDVNGCDLKKEGAYSKQLNNLNIDLKEGHNEDHITDDIDLVVLTPAVLYKDKYKNIPEIVKAFDTKETITWQKFLGKYIMKNNNIIAVSGTHGKTTTTTFLSLLLEKANFDPTCIIGGVVKEWQKTYRVGQSDWYVIEADEYNRNFLNYNPKYIILNNIEMEHPEFFKNFEDYKNNFRSFIKNVQKNGMVFFNYDDKNSLEVIESLNDFFLENNIKVVCFTFEKNKMIDDAPCKIHKVETDHKSNFTIENKNYKIEKVFGEHNIKNLAMATILAKNLNIDEKFIHSTLDNFRGAARRMDLIFKKEDKIFVYDDYGHHHTQIKENITALRNKIDKNDKIVAILEPHLVSRFKENYKFYLEYLQMADIAIITKCFKSREDYETDLNIGVYLDNINKISYLEDNEDIINKISNFIDNNIDSKVHILVMGAGLSYKLSNEIAEYFK